jgi:hypothetical protein
MDGRIGASVDNINSALTRDTCLVDNVRTDISPFYPILTNALKELKRLLVTPLPEGATLMVYLLAGTCLPH